MITNSANRSSSDSVASGRAAWAADSADSSRLEKAKRTIPVMKTATNPPHIHSRTLAGANTEDPIHTVITAMTVVYRLAIGPYSGSVRSNRATTSHCQTRIARNAV